MKNTLLAIAVLLSGSQLHGQNLIVDSLFGDNGRLFLNFNNADEPTRMLMQPDGKFLVSGFATGGYDIYTALSRFDICGITDSSFSDDGMLMHSFNLRNIPNDIALQDDGKIVCAGVESNSNYFSTHIPLVSRYTAAGTPDTTFSIDGFVAQRFDPISSGGFYSVKVYPDHRILCIGLSTYNINGGVTGYGAMRFTPDGNLDASFGGDGITRYTLNSSSLGEVRGHLLSDGNIVTVFSYITYYTFYSYMCASALDSTGALDSSFGTAGIFLDTIAILGETYTALQSDEQIVMAASGQAPSTILVRRISPEGTVDSTFGNGGHTIFTAPGGYTADVTGVRIISGGRILVFGRHVNSSFILALNADGSVDSIFGDGGYLSGNWSVDGSTHYTKDLLELSNGQLLVAGSTYSDYSMVRLIDISNVPHPAYDGATLSTTGGDFLQWYFEGNLIPGATNNSHVPQADGYYHVVATDSFGCSYTSDSVQVLNVSVDLMLNDDSSKVFPNPVSGDYLYIQSGGEKITEFVIHHLSGKELKRVADHRGIEKVEFNLPSGSYLVTLKTKDSTSAHVIMKAGD